MNFSPKTIPLVKTASSQAALFSHKTTPLVKTETWGGGGAAERQTQQLCAFVYLSRAREEDVELNGTYTSSICLEWSREC